uniref:hypothetical protein n=1 Tax=Jatropha curcas TaxID=180498 RepID=UPI0027A6CD72|nr:hypothetical protein QLP06_mgp033 [Jatropha curcas]WFG81206.1 hypothetical protein [Jatropha curcas]
MEVGPAPACAVKVVVHDHEERTNPNYVRTMTMMRYLDRSRRIVFVLAFCSSTEQRTGSSPRFYSDRPGEIKVFPRSPPQWPYEDCTEPGPRWPSNPLLDLERPLFGLFLPWHRKDLRRLSGPGIFPQRKGWSLGIYPRISAG